MSIDHDTVRIGTIGYTFGISDDGEIRVQVTGRGMVGDSDVITYLTIDRVGGDYVDAMFTSDLMPEPAAETQARWRADGYQSIGTYPPFEQTTEDIDDA